MARAPRCSVAGCQNYPKYKATGWCSKHYSRWRRHGDPHVLLIREKGTGHITSDGYIRIGRRYQHSLVMEKKLGRPLHPHENVHHRNGDRADNRLSNLELWSSRQPKGQRVQDKVKWANEILKLYGKQTRKPPASKRGH